MRSQPINFVWRRIGDGVLAMVPAESYRRVAARQFGEEGTEHTLVPCEDRNMRFHAACFAELGELYDNLPETVWYVTDADGRFVLEDGERIIRFPSHEHFRKWLLCDTGWCTTSEHEYANERAAKAGAKWLRADDPYARIRRSGSVVTVRKAVSQSLADMSKADFEASMDAILSRARSYVGVTAGVSRRSAGRTA